MQNKEKWRPSKYVYENGKLVASKDHREVSVGSRLITNIIANLYNENLGCHARGKLLDLGCGKVPLYEAYRPFISENICVDWISTLHKNDYIDQELDLTGPLPFEDSEFDTIILSDVLEHIPMPEKLWKEMARILSTNGKIIMNVPFYYWIHEAPHDYYRYTEFALRRFVDISGLRLVKIEIVGGAPEIIADVMAKNILKVPTIGRHLGGFIEWIATCFMNTQYGKKKSYYTRSKFPFAYFLIAEK